MEAPLFSMQMYLIARNIKLLLDVRCLLFSKMVKTPYYLNQGSWQSYNQKGIIENTREPINLSKIFLSGNPASRKSLFCVFINDFVSWL